MKTIYLRDENYNWKSFEYENLSDLTDKFESRKISIGYGASIGSYASIGDRASIGNKTKLTTGFYINGSRHTVTYVGGGKLSIGCHTKEIEWFKENYRLLGRKENYSESQQSEYYGYILLAEKYHANLSKEHSKH